MALVLVLMWASMAWASSEPISLEEGNPNWLFVSLIGNQDQIGLSVGVQNVKAAIGVDVRYLDDKNERDDLVAVTGVLIWKAVPKATIPIRGAVPFLDNEWLPETIEVGINGIGRLGWETENNDAVAVVGLEFQVDASEQISWALRYEYAFDPDAWGELTGMMPEHQVFFNMTYNFK